MEPNNADPDSGSSDEGQPVEMSWKRNELVLDKIFGFLPIKDLANVRLASKLWNAEGARTLAKKAVVHLTDWTFAGRQVAAEFSSAFDFGDFGLGTHAQMWSCQCEWRENINFFSIDYGNFKTTNPDTEFRPKKVVTLGYSCARRLSENPQFQSIQELELIALTGQQCAAILDNVSAWFPQLETLRFREMIPGDQVETCTSTRLALQMRDDYYCRAFLRKMKKDFRLVFASKYDEWCPLPYASIQMPTNKSNSLLTKLILEISPHCSNRDWSVLKSFPRLKTFQVLWWQNNPQGPSLRDANTANSCYAECLEKILPYMLANKCLKHLVLRFNLFWNEISRIQRVLNQLKVDTVSLQLINVSRIEELGGQSDRWTQQKEALIAFMMGLEDSAVAALDTLHIYCQPLNDRNGLRLLSIFSQLEMQKLFQKPTWNLILGFYPRSVRYAPKITQYLRLHKRENSLTFQVTLGPPWDVRRLHYEFESLVSLINPANDYNYAFHRVGSINDFENLNSSALFRPYFLTANWVSMEHLVCDECRSYPRFLCDLPGFREEAKLPRPQDHPSEKHVRTWTFCSVSRQILANWRVKLVSEIAAWRANSKCGCEWSDVVTRFKKVYAFQFVDSDCVAADQHEPDQSIYEYKERVIESSLASFGHGSSRARIFRARQVGGGRDEY